MESDQRPAAGEFSGRSEAPGGRPGQVWWLGLERKWWTLAAVGVGTFVSALNGSVVNTIVPVIMAWYGMDFAAAEWIVMIYLLVVSGLLLTFGRLGDMLGHKRVYIVGYSVLTVAASLCGVAPTAPILIALRALQAVGAAMVLSNSPAILTGAFPARQRGQALGMQGTMTYLGLMVGPALGGYLADQFGWQSVFLLNFPVGVLACILAYVAIAGVVPPARGESFDPPGALTFMGGLSALLLALSHGRDWGWTSGVVLVLLAAAILLLGTFLAIERRSRSPMLDLSLFRARIFTAAATSALMNYICMYAVTFLMPFYLIQFRGFSPAQAGLLLSSQALAMAVVAPLSGSLSDRIGSRLPSTLGMVIVTVGMAWLSTLGAAAGTAETVARLMLIGLGTGLFVSPNSSALMGAVSRQRQGIAAAVLASARNVGMVLGVALAGAVFASALAVHGGSLEAGEGFLPAFSYAFLVMSLFGLVGTVTSMVRGGRVAAPTKVAEQADGVVAHAAGQVSTPPRSAGLKQDRPER